MGIMLKAAKALDITWLLGAEFWATENGDLVSGHI